MVIRDTFNQAGVQDPVRYRRNRAFTLIEMLVVIAIIGLLAALTLGVGPIVVKAKNRSKAKTEIAKLQTIIERYKGKMGQYPPDNPTATNSGVNSLYYELLGTQHNAAAGNWTTLNGEKTLAYTTFVTYFGAGGLLNVTEGTGTKAENFFGDLRASDHATFNLSGVVPSVELLAVPVPGNPANVLTSGGVEINPVQYNSRSPAHNKGKFDLWIEVRVGNNEYETIGNW